MPGLNVHMYSSPFTHETRILRVTRSLIEGGVFARVLVVAALRQPGTAEREQFGERRSVWRIPTSIRRAGFVSKVLNALEWSARAFWGLRREKIECLNAHALSVLPLAVAIKLIKGCRLVYDAHEIETETTEMSGLRKKLSRLTERLAMPFVDVVALTSEGHGRWYRAEFPRTDVRVIRNCPYLPRRARPERSLLRTAFGIPENELLFLYQGAIARPRGTDLLLDVFLDVAPDRHIVFMGFGPGVERVKALEKERPNIHHHPAVAPGDVYLYTCGADVGIHMMDDSCINHLHALPNKPMEYMNAGIPAIVSDLPEMGSLIRESQAGWVVPVNDGETLGSLIRSLTPEEIAERAVFARRWTEANNWESEELKLFEMYRQLGFQPEALERCCE